MHPDAAKEYLELVLDYAYDIHFVRNFGGVNHAEFIYAQVAEIIAAFPFLKDGVLKKILATLEERRRDLDGESQRVRQMIPRDLILYLAHSFRWPELETMAQAHLYQVSQTDPDMVYYSWANKLLASLNDDWEDLEFYQTLRNSRVKPYPYETDV